MSYTLAVSAVLLVLLGGAESFAPRSNEALIKQRECSREGTLRTFRFSEARNTPLFCECLPGFDGRYCEQRICRHGSVRIVDLMEIDNEEGVIDDIFLTTACVCDPGFRGVSCEEKVERKPVPWTTVIAFLEPIVFFIIFLIPCCCALQMAREFVDPLFHRERYSPMYYDLEQALPSKQEPHCAGHCCEDTAPPAYYTNIYSYPQLPTVSPEMLQPIYTQTKIFPHV